MTLSDRDRMVLEFARLTWRHGGLQDDAIRSWFDCPPAVYQTRLNELLDDPAAAVYDAQLVARLRRLRDGRRRVARAEGFRVRE